MPDLTGNAKGFPLMSPRVRIWSLALVLIVVSACVPSRVDMLLSLLPTKVGERQFDAVTVIDDSFVSGHALDDILSAIGKSRSDAAAVFRGPRDGSISVGAVTVSGIDAQTLLDAVVNHWEAAAVEDRSLATIGGKEVWRLITRPSGEIAVYAKLGVVYVVLSVEANVLEDVVRAMP